LSSNPLSLLTDWHAYVLVAVGISALILNQNAFQGCSLAAPLTALTLSEPIVGLLIGVTAFHEDLSAGGLRSIILAVAMMAMVRAVWLAGSAKQAPSGCAENAGMAENIGMAENAVAVAVAEGMAGSEPGVAFQAGAPPTHIPYIPGQLRSNNAGKAGPAGGLAAGLAELGVERPRPYPPTDEGSIRRPVAVGGDASRPANR
jgi:hypothetical protein